MALNGGWPIIIFHFYELPFTSIDLTTTVKIPFMVDQVKIPLFNIPLQINEKNMGVVIVSENKSVNIDTEVTAVPDGGAPIVEQQAVGNILNVEFSALQDSIGLSIIMAMIDIILPKVKSQTYRITYAHNAVTAFFALLEDISVVAVPNTNLYNVSLRLNRSTGNKTKEKEAVTGSTAVPNDPQAIGVTPP